MKELIIYYHSKKKCILTDPRVIENDYNDSLLFNSIQEETLKRAIVDPKLKKAIKITVEIRPDEIGWTWYIPNRNYS